MTKSEYMIAALTALAVVLTSVQAAERPAKRQPTMQRMQNPVFQIPPVFTCHAAQDRDFSSNVEIKLFGPGPVAAGTKIQVKLANANHQKIYVLPALSPQQSITIDTKVANASAFFPCTVNVAS